MGITYPFDPKTYCPANRLDFLCADVGASYETALLEGDYLGYWDLRDYRILAPLVEFVRANGIPLDYFRDAVLPPEQIEILWSFFREYHVEFASLLQDDVFHANENDWYYFTKYRTASILFLAWKQQKAIYTVAD